LKALSNWGGIIPFRRNTFKKDVSVLFFNRPLGYCSRNNNWQWGEKNQKRGFSRKANFGARLGVIEVRRTRMGWTLWQLEG